MRLAVSPLYSGPPRARGNRDDQRERDVGEQQEDAEEHRVTNEMTVMPTAQRLSIHLLCKNRRNSGGRAARLALCNPAEQPHRQLSPTGDGGTDTEMVAFIPHPSIFCAAHA